MQMRKISNLLILVMLVMVLATPALASGYTRTLHFGHRGDDVIKLQQALKYRGYYSSNIDGIYGLKTEWAVIKFQIDNKLRIDGFAGPETQKALYNTAHYTSKDVFWLARIIEAEAGGEPYEGKVAVGNVVLNRVKSKDFPNTIYDVIFEYYGNIPQFSPVANGTIYNTPSQESINAAKDALNGYKPVGNATYFFNPNKAAGSWIVKSKSYVAKIGSHVFYQ